jgi:hypothetical protein
MVPMVPQGVQRLPGRNAPSRLFLAWVLSVLADQFAGLPVKRSCSPPGVTFSSSEAVLPQRRYWSSLPRIGIFTQAAAIR